MWFSLKRTTSMVAYEGGEAGNPGTLRDDKKERVVSRKGRLLYRGIFQSYLDNPEVQPSPLDELRAGSAGFAFLL
jgi:hypothetical protein